MTVPVAFDSVFFGTIISDREKDILTAPTSFARYVGGRLTHPPHLEQNRGLFCFLLNGSGNVKSFVFTGLELPRGVDSFMFFDLPWGHVPGCTLWTINGDLDPCSQVAKLC